jgi:hypothetical protein
LETVTPWFGDVRETVGGVKSVFPNTMSAVRAVEVAAVTLILVVVAGSVNDAPGVKVIVLVLSRGVGSNSAVFPGRRRCSNAPA